jgi:hypothetical protein
MEYLSHSDYRYLYRNPHSRPKFHDRVDRADGIRPIWGYMLVLLLGLIVVAIFSVDFDRFSLGLHEMEGGR